MQALVTQIKPFHETQRFTLFCGDYRSVLPTLDDCSVDSIVTDPPYELGFMGKGWDRSGIAYDVEAWRECLRVLKPGGHLLAFGGSRTYHRLACAAEDAGFEIRDQIQWIYGSGFPKSLDVSKAIDRMRNEGAEFELRCAEWIADRCEALGLTRGDLDRAAGTSDMGGWWASRLPHRCQIPTLEQWQKLEPVLGEPPEWMKTAILPASMPGQSWFQRQVIAERANGYKAHYGGSEAATRTVKVTEATLDAAKQWNGWGTALKPAHEPIVLARKPLIGTVAENVLKHGTGGLNIDGCRIEPTGERLGGGSELPRTFQKPDGWDRPWMHDPEHTAAHAAKVSANVEKATAFGRWPSNVCHDGSEEVLAAFPNAPGQLRANSDSQRTQGLVYSKISRNGTRINEPREDFGSAARFFYCAKSSQEDRNEGLEGLPIKSAGEVTDRKDGSAGLNSPRAGAGRTNGSRNNHPTVKPTELMRYLCRLITPPGGIVLDPFTGSGSTGKAAMLEGLRFIGIELSEDYCELAQRRIEAVTKQGMLFT